MTNHPHRSKQQQAKHTPGPWEYVPSNEYHGPYVTSEFGNTICDCYVMSQPGEASTLNGGPSKPIPFLAEMADPNARLIAAAPETAAERDRLKALNAELLAALKLIIESCECSDLCDEEARKRIAFEARAAIAKAERC